MMQNGFGAFFVKVFDANGTDITPEGISKFTFVHSEKSDDYSTLVIENSKIDLADKPEFQEGKPITFLWGYIGGETQRATQIIGEAYPTYEDTVKFNILCYERAAWLRNNSKGGVYNNTNLEDLTKKKAEENNLNYLGVEKGGTVGTPEPLQSTDDGFLRTGRDHTSNPIFIPLNQVTQDNKSDRELLNEHAEKEPNGPWMVVSHGSDLLIRKRNFNQKPIRTYIYKGGDGHFLKFTPETKKKRKKKDATNLNVKLFDRPGKKFLSIPVIEQNNDDTRIGGSHVDIGEEDNLMAIDNAVFLDEDNNILDNQDLIKTGLKVKLSNREEDWDGNTNLSQDTINNLLKLANSPNSKNSFKPLFNQEINYVNETGFDVTARDHTAIIQKIPNTETSGNSTLLSPLKLDEAKGQAYNQRAEDALDQNPGKLEVIGWPSLESGKILTLKGLSKKDSGNWYISSVEHELDKHKGYICYVNLIRNAYTSPEQTPNKVKVKDIGKPLNNQEGDLKGDKNKTTTLEEILEGNKPKPQIEENIDIPVDKVEGLSQILTNGIL